VLSVGTDDQPQELSSLLPAHSYAVVGPSVPRILFTFVKLIISDVKEILAERSLTLLDPRIKGQTSSVEQDESSEVEQSSKTYHLLEFIRSLSTLRSPSFYLG